MTVVFAVANQKGGVGKTTTAIALSGLLSTKRQKVLLVDLDPHGSISSYLGAGVQSSARGLYCLFTPELVLSRKTVLDAIIETEIANLHLLPASLALATLDRQSGQRGGLGLILSSALKYIQQDYDFIILDCPPVAGVLMINALAACNLLLIPVQTEYLALQGLARMIQTIDMVQKSNKAPLNHLIVPTLYDCRARACMIALEKMRSLYGDLVWHSSIPTDTKFRDASMHGVPPSLFAPTARGVVAYHMLLKEIVHKMVITDETATTRRHA